EGAGPRPQHEHGADLDRRTQPEAVGLHGLARALAVRLLEQLDQDRSREEERKRGERDAVHLPEGGEHGGDTEDDRAQASARRPHTSPIGRNDAAPYTRSSGSAP